MAKQKLNTYRAGRYFVQTPLGIEGFNVYRVLLSIIVIIKDLMSDNGFPLAHRTSIRAEVG